MISKNKKLKEKSQKTSLLILQWTKEIILTILIVFTLKSTVFCNYHVPTGSAIPTILPGDRILANKLVYKFGLEKIQRGDYVTFDDMNHKYDKSNKLTYWWQKYVGIPIPFLGIKSGPINVTKRIIAIPGDQIEGRIENKKPVIYLNGKKLYEPYTNPYPLILLNKTSGFIPMDSIGPIPVPNFLRKKTSPAGGSYCAYDPNKSFDSQPYFTANPSDVIYIPEYPSITFRLPNTPTYKDDFEKRHCADIFGPITVPEGKYWGMGDNRKDSADSRWFGFLDEDRIQGRISYILWSIESEEPFWLLEFIKHPIDFWKKSVRWNRFFQKPTHVTTEERQVQIPDRITMLKRIAEEARQEIL